MAQAKTKLYVVCPMCSGVYHSLTRKYRSKTHAHPGMLQLLDRYKDYGWEEPVPDDSAGYGCIVCPNCEASMAPSGYLKVQKRNIEEVEG